MLHIPRLGHRIAHASGLTSSSIVHGDRYRVFLRTTLHTTCCSSPEHCSAGIKPSFQGLSTRSAASMVDHVDLTLSDSDDDIRTPALPAAGPKVSSQDEAAAKKRIMDFAANQAAAKRTRLDNDDETVGFNETAAAASRQPAADEAAEQAAQKLRIVNFAKAKAATAAAADAQTAPQSPGGKAGTAAQAPPPAATAAAADQEAAPCGGGFDNSDLRALHEARMCRQQQQQQQNPAAGGSSTAAGGAGQQPAAAATGGAPGAAGGPSGSSKRVTDAPATAASKGVPSSQKTISLLTYNVWFKEDVAVLDRMMAIGDIIKQAGHPTVICLQEVTPFILELFINMDWWSQYHCCPPPGDAPYFTLLLVHKAAAPGVSSSSFRERPFYNSVMGRSLRSITSSIAGLPILVATSHLESPIPPGNWYSKQRQEQMNEALKHLDAAGVGNVLFAGDMNWTDSRDGSPPLPSGWVDAWQKLQGGQPGFTYDSKSNPMLTFKGQGLRLDRIFCKLRDWKLQSIKLVGTQLLPGVQHTHTFRNGGSKKLPVLPSDHFGLLLQLEEF